MGRFAARLHGVPGDDAASSPRSSRGSSSSCSTGAGRLVRGGDPASPVSCWRSTGRPGCVAVAWIRVLTCRGGAELCQSMEADCGPEPDVGCMPGGGLFVLITLGSREGPGSRVSCSREGEWPRPVRSEPCGQCLLWRAAAAVATSRHWWLCPYYTLITLYALRQVCAGPRARPRVARPCEAGGGRR